MSDAPEWKKLMREPNALGWLAFLVLMVAIGVGAIFFDNGPVPKAGSSAAQIAHGTSTGLNGRN